jgi:hypothetical protein
MGSVAMGAGGTYTFEGYNVTEIAHCLYCDTCGSFNIGKRLRSRALGSIFLAAIVAAVFSYSLGSGNAWVLWLVCFGPLMFFIGLTGIFASGHVCKQCGAIHTTMENVRGYPEYDRSVLDVPYEATVKHYTDD